jgi:membrane protein YdbS with pleckstrin-like domain
MVYRQTRYANWAVVLLLLILATNVLLYQLPIQHTLSIEIESGVVIGSLIDLAVVAPLLAYFAFKLSIKQTMGMVASGLILARFLIPAELFAPYKGILYTGIAAEGLFLAAEMALLFYVVRKIPYIRREMNGTSVLYSMLPAVEKAATKNKFVAIIISEFMMFYYAFFTWRKKAPVHDGVVTMHIKTSAVAMNMMLIHAIVIETIGIHWWLHEKSMIISIILLILNIYSVIFFLAETQVIRLHPVEIKDGQLYAAQGLTQRITVPLEMIKEIKWGGEPSKKALQFMLRDFEPVEAQVVIELHEPVEAVMFMGRKKRVTELAFRVDEPGKLKMLLQDVSSN